MVEMVPQAEKGKAFRALHGRDAAFIIPNPWDVGCAHVLAHMGFEALATTSGYAFSIGKRDTAVGREQMLEHIAAVAHATAAARALPFTFTLTARAETRPARSAGHD